MKRLNFIDALFNNEGHYIDDIINYKYLLKDYEVHYFVNGEISQENKKQLEGFILHESSTNDKSIFGGIKYLVSIKNQLGANDLNFIMSCKYTSLFLFSVFNRFYNYYLLVHFFPTVRRNLYRAILNYLLKNCNGFMVLDNFVKDDILNKLGILNSSKIFVIHTRDIKKNQVSLNRSGKIKLSFIGSMSQYKDISLLINLIKKNHYQNIEFGFYSKGILPYLQNIETTNILDVQDRYFSRVEYNRLLCESDFVFLSYTKDYGVRFSGILCDALNSGCQLICNDNPSFKYFIKKYNCGYIFRDEDELHKILMNLRKLSINEKIYYDYSEETRKQLFLNIIENFYGVKK